ncbi:MAG: MFS transporter [Gemmatimonadetes bacterium]|nr:MFS transporter [Gemmatimonadota bacterium]MDA1103395.1 MFS transporter [Gemmatimonadota bacterium]
MLRRIRIAFKALRHRNLRLFFTGQGISLVGTWMQQVAMGWLVYRLTDSALFLGVISFCAQFPGFIMAPLAGAWADRWNRYRMVVVAQTLSMVQAVALAVLVIYGTVAVWHLIVLAVAMGLINGVDVPARQSLLVELVGGVEDLPNAIALNSSLFNAARLVGPALGGLLIGWVGEGPVFVVNAVSYAAVLGALAMLQVSNQPGGAAGPVLQHIREGFAYAYRSAPLRDTLIVLAVVSLVGIPYVVLLPVFARDVLGGDASTLGLLTSAAGLGSLVGALILASRSSLRGLGRLIAVSTAVFSVTLIGFALSRNLVMSLILLAVTGVAIMLCTASINTVLQTLVKEEMRGRVMALYTMAFVGMTPIGGLAGGAIADRVGAPIAVVAGGLGSLVLAIWFWRRLPDLREIVTPVYEELGIIPEVARGLQGASDLRPRT